MAAHISLILNHARQEVLREGWGVIKSAKAFVPAEYVTIADEGNPEYPGYFTPGTLPDEAWFEPTQGLLGLKPNFLRDNWLYDSSVEEGAFLASTDYVFGNSAEWEEYAGLEDDGQLHQFKFQQTLRDLADTTGVLTALGSLSPDLTALSALTTGEVAPVLRTKNPFSKNEGIGLLLWNFGYAGERDEAYRWGLFFGGRWFLRQHVSGKWTLYRNWGTQLVPDWQMVDEHHVSQGAVSSNEPLHVAILPLPPKYLAFYISTASAPTDRTRRYAGTAGPAFIHEVEGLNPDRTEIDPDMLSPGNAFFFAQLGQDVAGVLKKGINYALSMHRVRYPETASIALMSEALPRPIPEVAATAADNLWYYGFNLKDNSSTYIVKSLRNRRDQAWTAASDKYPTPKVVINSFDGNKRSPYILGYEFRWPTVTYTPTTTPIDLSGNWTRINFTLSEDPGGNPLTVHMQRFASWDKLLKLDATLRLEIDGAAVWDGYIEDIANTVVGSKGKTISDGDEHQVMMLTSIEGYDMWDRLEQTRLPRYVGVHHLSLYRSPNAFQRIADAIEFGGMVATEVGSGLSDIDLPYWNLIDEMPAVTEDSTPADEIRDSVDTFGVQQRKPVRATYNGDSDEWEVGLGDVYAVDPSDPTEEELPTVFLVLDASIIEEIEGSVLTDIERWDELADRRYILGLSDLEFTNRRAQYNALSVYSGTSADQHAKGLAVHIDPDYDAIQDEDHVDFQAGVRTMHHTPREAHQGTNTNDLARVARHRFAEFCTTERILNIRGEWQPFVRPPMFVAVIGRDPDGAIVSFGAWRIATAQVELAHDKDESPTTGFGTHPDRRYQWEAEYTMFYEGVADYVIDEVTIPMFSEVLP